MEQLNLPSTEPRITIYDLGDFLPGCNAVVIENLLDPSLAQDTIDFFKIIRDAPELAFNKTIWLYSGYDLFGSNRPDTWHEAFLWLTFGGGSQIGRSKEVFDSKAKPLISRLDGRTVTETDIWRDQFLLDLIDYHKSETEQTETTTAEEQQIEVATAVPDAKPKPVTASSVLQTMFGTNMENLTTPEERQLGTLLMLLHEQQGKPLTVAKPSFYDAILQKMAEAGFVENWGEGFHRRTYHIPDRGDWQGLLDAFKGRSV